MPSRFIYPRTILVRRPNQQAAGGGQLGYSGLSPNNETLVVSNVQASIQLAGEPGNPTGLPSGVNLDDYRIFGPKNAIAKGTVDKRDVVIDDLGVRYRVIAPYWDSLGYNLYCRRSDDV